MDIMQIVDTMQMAKLLSDYQKAENDVQLNSHAVRRIGNIQEKCVQSEDVQVYGVY